ncbi:N-acetylmuramoyl-L-alanine amidase [Candidatus Omnitrophota bacterium]
MNRRLFRVFVLLFALFIAGCVTTQKKVVTTPTPEALMVSVADFCRTYSLEYTYRPFYEEVILFGDFLNIILKPDSRYASINGYVKEMPEPLTYRQGEFLASPYLKEFLKVFKEKASKQRAAAVPLAIEIVVIDPGHGGRDPGAISPWGVREKDINLQVAKSLYGLLKEKGFKPYLTRDRDVFVSLKDRVTFAKKKGADLFISVHSNANRSRQPRGLEVYYLSPKFSDNQSKVLATAENLVQNEGLRLSSGLKRIIGEMLNSENKRETQELVRSIMNSAESMGIYTRKSIGAPFYVLKHNVCPAVLVEMGYLTNYKEERLLRTSLYKKQLALAIAEGVSRLRESLSRNVALER